MKNISILVPTRNRVELLKNMVRSVFSTAHTKEKIQILIYIDDDDEATKSIIETISSEYNQKFGGSSIKYFIHPRLFSISKSINFLCEFADSEIYMFCNDDVLFKTENWDDLVIDAFNKYEDKLIFCHGYDGIWQKNQFGTMGFLHKNWIKTVGYFLPDHFIFDFGDIWINDVFNKLDRRVYVEMFVEHLHYTTGKRSIETTDPWRWEIKPEEDPAAAWELKKHLIDEDVLKSRFFMEQFK